MEKSRNRTEVSQETQTQTLRFVECIPATFIPRSQPQQFTYLWNAQNKPTIGQIVEITLGRKKIKGVIAKIYPLDTSLPYKVKPISSIISHIPSLPEETMELARFISNYYFTPISFVYKTLLPVIPKRVPVQNTKKNHKEQLLPKLTKEQHQAVEEINNTSSSKTFLLHGATGSGKTEVYLHAIQKILSRKQQAIVLVPEISLTPQAQDRYSQRFGAHNVSITHSNQTTSQRFQAWYNFFTGTTSVLIGPRSAILAPSKNLGLIIIDEAHERTYKQWDQHPRYDARTVAQQRSVLHRIPLVLGSATPRLDDIAKTSYLKRTSQRIKQSTESPNISILPLSTRIRGNVMPIISTIDMRTELRSGNTSPISLSLQKAIQETLSQNKQVVLFMNRRGTATFVLCRDCGYVCECPNCSVPLTYHQYHRHLSHLLLCHHCNYHTPSPTECPKCKSTKIKFFGTGTERIESEIQCHFPKARLARMDSDTVEARGSHEKIYKQFEGGKIDILIGTQMITKGWDIPSVDLVGIVAADALLHLPDFRSSERAFQLLTQVAGRCGRGDDRGKVLIQTYNPEHPVIKAVTRYDQQTFYSEELNERNIFQYPPVVQCIQVSIEHTNKEKSKELSINTMHKLQQHIPSTIQILGPSPAFIAKMNKLFRWNILLKLPKQISIQERNNLLKLLDDTVSVDIDPETLL